VRLKSDSKISRTEPAKKEYSIHKRDNLDLIIFLIFALAPVFIQSPYYRDWLISTFLWAGTACAWNIIGGYAGQLSIGHAAFFGIGAYSSTLLYLHFGISPWIGMIIGGIFSTITAAVVGIATLRLRGTFFVLATIAFTEVVRLMAIAWRDLTRGSLGVSLDYKAGFLNMMWQDKLPYVYLSLAFLAAIYAICKLIEGNKFGYFLVAIREDQDAAQSLGVNIAKYKTLAFMLSSFLTSIGGSIYAFYIFYIDPDFVFGIMISVQLLLIAIVGGRASALGPILGAIIVVPLGSFLRGQLTAISGLHGFLYGLALTVVIIFAPDGIFGFYLKQMRKRIKR
jgi:branched-chain amino acid transport system permease protein